MNIYWFWLHFYHLIDTTFIPDGFEYFLYHNCHTVNVTNVQFCTIFKISPSSDKSPNLMVPSNWNLFDIWKFYGSLKVIDTPVLPKLIIWTYFGCINNSVQLEEKSNMPCTSAQILLKIIYQMIRCKNSWCSIKLNHTNNNYDWRKPYTCCVLK